MFEVAEQSRLLAAAHFVLRAFPPSPPTLFNVLFCFIQWGLQAFAQLGLGILSMLAPVRVLTFPLVAELPCPIDTAGGHVMAKRPAAWMHIYIYIYISFIY